MDQKPHSYMKTRFAINYTTKTKKDLNAIHTYQF